MTARRVSELGELSPAEKQVYAELDSGSLIKIGDGKLPTRGDSARIVRAALIRLLVLGNDRNYRVHEAGLRICGAWVPECLYFDGCRLSKILMLICCRFDAALRFQGAVLESLHFDGSEFPTFSADHLEARGVVNLRYVSANGVIRLPGARLGSLNCQGGTFRANIETPTTPDSALFADGIEVRENIVLSNTTITGSVKLVGARLGGDLKCSGARLQSVGQNATILADRLQADALILDDVQARGEIKLHDAHLRSLLCSGGKFIGNRSLAGEVGFSFSADRAKFDGAVIVRYARGVGEFRLPGAKIAGSVDCYGSQFSDGRNCSGSFGYALSLDSSVVEGDVDLRCMWASGEVTFQGARLGSDLNCDGVRLQCGNEATGAYGRALNLTGATIGGSLFLRGGHAANGRVDATAAQIGIIIDEPSCWPAKGFLHLDRCHYGAFASGKVDVCSRLDWLDRQYPPGRILVFWPQPYEQLAKVLNEMGHEDEAKTVLVTKERRLRAAEFQRLTWYRKPAHWAFTQLLRMVGYGYRPQQAVWPALAIVLLGWGLVEWANEAGVLVRSVPAEAGAPVLIPLAYSFEAFVPIVTLGQTEAFRSDMATPAGWWVQIYLWAHGFLGWLIGGLAVAGVFGLFRRN